MSYRRLGPAAGNSEVAVTRMTISAFGTWRCKGLTLGLASVSGRGG